MNIDTVEKVKRSKAFTALDIAVVIVLITAIALGAYFIYRVPPATVTVSAPDYNREFSLDDDKTVVLEHLVIHIRSGKVWVTDADCADKTCEHTGKIGRAGQSIVCLPNSVVVTINGASDLQWEVGR